MSNRSLEELANDGNAEAQYLFGMQLEYEKTEGVSADLGKALRWYMRAAN